MVALVLKTFVARLLLLIHFQLCVSVCVLCLSFLLLLYFFFFMLLLSVYHSLDNDRSTVETWCFNAGFYRSMFSGNLTFKLFCFILFCLLFLFLLFCFVSNSIPMIIYFLETLRCVVVVFFVCLSFQTSDVCIHTTA